MALIFESEKQFKKWSNQKNAPKTKTPKKPTASETASKPAMVFLGNQIEFFFPNQLHPSINEYMRWHWSKTYEVVQTWHWLVKASLNGRKVFVPDPKIFTTYYFPNRIRRDRGNRIPKFLIDALVKERIILDDCSKILTETMPQFEYVPGLVGTRVSLASLSGSIIVEGRELPDEVISLARSSGRKTIR